jgi:hypothetical protein
MNEPTQDSLERQLEKWQQALLFLGGATTSLLLITLTELPLAMSSDVSALVINGWYAVWFLLEIASLTAGLGLIIARGWRPLPFRRRLHTAFAFLGLGWLALLAFALRTTSLTGLTPVYVALGAGLCLGMIYVMVARNTTPSGEMFP